MGAEMLRENLEELGLDESAITTLESALFPGGGDDDDDDGLELEENAGPTPSGAPPLPAPQLPANLPASQPVDVLPNDLTQEEIDAAEAEAQWLLNPLSLLDLSQTKEKLMQLMYEGTDYQKGGQYANARASYTRAIGMEAPNKRMTAALYYNRSACQRQLGQLQLALRDAQQAAELEPKMLKAHWRAADVAIILGDHEAARESITAGLKESPRCTPLLQLKLQLK